MSLPQYCLSTLKLTESLADPSGSATVQVQPKGDAPFNRAMPKCLRPLRRLAAGLSSSLPVPLMVLW